MGMGTPRHIREIAYAENGIVVEYNVIDGLSVSLRGKGVIRGVSYIGDPSTIPRVGSSVRVCFHDNDWQRPFVDGSTTGLGTGSSIVQEDELSDVMQWPMYGHDQGRSFSNTATSEPTIATITYPEPLPVEVVRLPELGWITEEDIPYKDFKNDYGMGALYDGKIYSLLPIEPADDFQWLVEYDTADTGLEPRQLKLTNLPENPYHVPGTTDSSKIWSHVGYSHSMCIDGKKLLLLGCCLGFSVETTKVFLTSIDLTSIDMQVEGTVTLENTDLLFNPPHYEVLQPKTLYIDMGNYPDYYGYWYGYGFDLGKPILLTPQPNLVPLCLSTQRRLYQGGEACSINHYLPGIIPVNFENVTGKNATYISGGSVTSSCEIAVFPQAQRSILQDQRRSLHAGTEHNYRYSAINIHGAGCLCYINNHVLLTYQSYGYYNIPDKFQPVLAANLQHAPVDSDGRAPYGMYSTLAYRQDIGFAKRRYTDADILDENAHLGVYGSYPLFIYGIYGKCDAMVRIAPWNWPSHVRENTHVGLVASDYTIYTHLTEPPIHSAYAHVEADTSSDAMLLPEEVPLDDFSFDAWWAHDTSIYAGEQHVCGQVTAYYPRILSRAAVVVCSYNNTISADDRFVKTKTVHVDDWHRLPDLPGYNNYFIHKDRVDRQIITCYVWDVVKYSACLPTVMSGIAPELSNLQIFYNSYYWSDGNLLPDYMWNGAVTTAHPLECAKPHHTLSWPPAYKQMAFSYVSGDVASSMGPYWVGNLVYTADDAEQSDTKVIDREYSRHHQLYKPVAISDGTRVVFKKHNNGFADHYMEHPDRWWTLNCEMAFKAYQAACSGLVHTFDYKNSRVTEAAGFNDPTLYNRGISFSTMFSPTLKAYTVEDGSLLESWCVAESTTAMGNPLATYTVYNTPYEELPAPVQDRNYIHYRPHFINKAVLYSPVLLSDGVLIVKILEIDLEMLSKEIPYVDSRKIEHHVSGIFFTYVSSYKHYIAGYDFSTGQRLWRNRSLSRLSQATRIIQPTPHRQEYDNGITLIMDNKETKAIEVDQPFGEFGCSDGEYLVISAVNAHPVADYYFNQNNLGIRQDKCGVVFGTTTEEPEDNYGYSGWDRVPRPERYLECFNLKTGTRLWAINYSDMVVHLTETPDNITHFAAVMGQPYIHRGFVYVPIAHRIIRYNLKTGVPSGGYDILTKKGIYGSYDSYKYTIEPDGYPVVDTSIIPAYGRIYYRTLRSGIEYAETYKSTSYINRVIDPISNNTDKEL